MIRGTTVTHTFNVDLKASEIKELKVTYSQGGRIVLFRKLADCEVTDNTIVVKLLQEDTFKFDSSKHVNIQIRVLTNDDQVSSTPILTVSVGACLDNEVLV